MPIPGNLATTAMAVMPHTDVDRALDLALSLDVPFWPQLPRMNYYEDMYVQASEHFPGMIVNHHNRTLRFSIDKFSNEFEEIMAHFEEPGYFDISHTYSVVYHRFLERDLRDRSAIHGQLEGPISFGMNVHDQDSRPILFDDTIRPFMLEVMAKRVNTQLSRLKEKNENAFMYVDEPGLQYIFSALSGYDDQRAKHDMNIFFSMINRPRGVHLCGNPDWDFLFNLDLDILSLDAYTNREIIASCGPSIRKFLDRGGMISWGIVPTNFEPFEKEGLKSLEKYITGIWHNLSKSGLDLDFLLSKSLLSPATCCLVNPDIEKTVEKAFTALKNLSETLRSKYRLLY
ncbi:MAG: hypothetical protein ACMUIP_09490 [bacterium]